VYYINPLQYAYTSIVLNEFLSGEYDYPCSDPRVDLATATFCRGKPDTSVAEAYLAIYKFPEGFGQVWAGIGVLLAYYVFLTGLTFIAMERIRCGFTDLVFLKGPFRN
jgi:ABC-type multidrug transport system permease subunit